MIGIHCHILSGVDDGAHDFSPAHDMTRGQTEISMADAAIIGGGPAGLNAALVLGRARRTVALIDDGKPRNRVTHASHGFLTRDGVTPAEFRELAHAELDRYPGVSRYDERVIRIEKAAGGFTVVTESRMLYARKLLLAMGLRDQLPNIEGLDTIYGQSAFTCPYCDGWEHRDEPIAVIARGAVGFHMAQVLTGWSADIVLCTHGESLAEQEAIRLEGWGIPVRSSRIVRLESEQRQLRRILFEDGTSIERRAAFVHTKPVHGTGLYEALGCGKREDGSVLTDEMGKTTVEGVFAAGDAAHVRFNNLVIAAADGVKAAIAINAELIHERLTGGNARRG